MSSKFRIFSTEIDATTDPDNASPAPVTLIAFNQDPLFATYNPEASESDRGTVIKTFSGNVIQDFGVVESDGRISFSDQEALSTHIAGKLKEAYEVVDGEWYFTDGYDCWKVQFSRNPRGFKTFRNLIYSAGGNHLFSYEINLVVVSVAYSSVTTTTTTSTTTTTTS